MCQCLKPHFRSHIFHLLLILTGACLARVPTRESATTTARTRSRAVALLSCGELGVDGVAPPALHHQGRLHAGARYMAQP
jgi:hypothetical protein